MNNPHNKTLLSNTEGSAFEVTKTLPGVVRISTGKEVRYLRGHSPLNLDMLVHFRPDHTTAIVRAFVGYRFGNPTGVELIASERLEVLRDVLNQVHAWRKESESEVGIVVEVDEKAQKQEMAQRAVDAAVLVKSQAKRALWDAENANDMATRNLASARANLSLIKNLPSAETILATAVHKPVFVFQNYVVNEQVTVEAKSFQDAMHVMAHHLGINTSSARDKNEFMVLLNGRHNFYFIPGSNKNKSHDFTGEQSLSERYHHLSEKRYDETYVYRLFPHVK